MAWRRPGDKPLSEPMMVSLLKHICVTRPQCFFLSLVWTSCSTKESNCGWFDKPQRSCESTVIFIRKYLCGPSYMLQYGITLGNWWTTNRFHSRDWIGFNRFKPQNKTPIKLSFEGAHLAVVMPKRALRFWLIWPIFNTIGDDAMLRLSRKFGESNQGAYWIIVLTNSSGTKFVLIHQTCTIDAK